MTAYKLRYDLSATSVGKWRESHPAMGWKMVREEADPLIDELLARTAGLEAALAMRDRMYRDERLLRQKAESALTEAIRHPNGKLSRISEYVYRIEHARAKEGSEWARAEQAIARIAELEAGAEKLQWMLNEAMRWVGDAPVSLEFFERMWAEEGIGDG